MSTEPQFNSADDLFRAKERNRSTLASCPIEQKIAKLLQLQKIACEIARSTGRSSQQPWNIKVPECKTKED